MTEATGPLAGIRILDLTTVLFGPFGAQTLGDWGAELVKVEGLTGDQWRYTGQFRNRGMSGQFMAANRIPEVTVVADAGMLSDGNLKALSAAGLRYIVGQPIPKVFYQLEQWQKTHPGQDPVDQMILTQPWARGSLEAQQSETIYYQYRADRARRSLRGIAEQVRKAADAVAGKTAVKRNRVFRLEGGSKSVNRGLDAKTLTLGG